MTTKPKPKPKIAIKYEEVQCEELLVEVSKLLIKEPMREEDSLQQSSISHEEPRHGSTL